MTPTPLGGNAVGPWIGDRIQDRAEDVISFLGTAYAIRLVAAADSLTWSVPEGTPQTRDGRSSFESAVERFALTATIEVWRFPKLERGHPHEIVLLIDRELGTVASMEIMVQPGARAPRPAMSVLRGTIDGHSTAYAGFAFPRFRPDARRLSFELDADAPSFIEFDRSGQPSAVGRGDDVRRASGHALQIVSGIWATVWRTADAAGITLFDERAGIINGQSLAAGEMWPMTYGVRARIDRTLAGA